MRYQDIPQFTKSAGYRVNVTWNYLESWIESQLEINLDLDPDFQRAHVWTEDQQRRYVEFVLRGGQSGKDVFFNCVGWMGNFRGPFVLVDGKQRIEAVRRFLGDDLAIFSGHLHRDIGGFIPVDANFLVHVNNLETRAEVLQWYLDLNEGGVVHTQAELNKVRELLKGA